MVGLMRCGSTLVRFDFFQSVHINRFHSIEQNIKLSEKFNYWKMLGHQFCIALSKETL